MTLQRTSEEIEIIFDFLRIDFEQGDERADDKSKGEDLIEMIPAKARAGYAAGYADPEYLKILPTFSTSSR